ATNRSTATPGGTRFVVVRYGNVLASRGSVVPLVLDQIARGAPVTVTVPEMTRFLITLDDAVDTIMRAVGSARPGEILVPVTPSTTVINIAAALIGDRGGPVELTGVRPRANLHEVLVSPDEAVRSRRDGRYFVVA
nr:polysaccharide biosynthesis protein [Micromonospora sp. DSM 115978]